MRGSQGKIRSFAEGKSGFRMFLGFWENWALILITSTSLGYSEDWESQCGQAVVVLTSGWEASEGTLRTFERKQGTWEEVRGAIPVVVGRNGLGWGLGLHAKRGGEPQKQEGDRRAPAGIFRLEFGFGRVAFPEKKFPFRQALAKDRWVDDPKSRFYNQWVVEDDPRFPNDWSSAEVMARRDGLYDHVIVVSHNRRPIIPGRGSAIFIHRWSAKGKPTIGCTAMAREEVKGLLNWLDAGENPVLVQIPVGQLSQISLPLDLQDAIQTRMR